MERTGVKKVALATHTASPRLTEDDRLLIPALRELGIETQPAVWGAANVDWCEFDQVVIRSCWDYHLRLPEFLAWIAALDAQHVELQNPAPLLRWNADKRYLCELEKLGVLIPETCWLEAEDERCLREIMAEHNWDKAVVKPTVSTIAYKTQCISRAEANGTVRGPLIVQEFVPEIIDQGEWSLTSS